MGKLGTLLATAASGLALAGCVDVDTKNDKAPETTTAELTPMAAVVEVKVRTQAECRALVNVTKDEKLACMREAKAARQAEIAALDENIQTEKEANKERRTTNEVLSKEFQQMAREEFKKDARPQN